MIQNAGLVRVVINHIKDIKRLLIIITINIIVFERFGLCIITAINCNCYLIKQVKTIVCKHWKTP